MWQGVAFPDEAASPNKFTLPDSKSLIVLVNVGLGPRVIFWVGHIYKVRKNLNAKDSCRVNATCKNVI